jgi:hypothetical protein
MQDLIYGTFPSSKWHSRYPEGDFLFNIMQELQFRRCVCRVDQLADWAVHSIAFGCSMVKNLIKIAFFCCIFYR